MSQNGARSPQTTAVSIDPQPEPVISPQNSEYSSQLTKTDLDASLSAMYEKLANKIQSELHKATSTLTQEIVALEGRTDIAETKHDELSLAHNDLRKDYELLAKKLFLQSQVEDLDNRNCRNNLRICGVPKSITELMPAMSKLFHSLLPEKIPSSFACNRIHRALHPKQPPASS